MYRAFVYLRAGSKISSLLEDLHQCSKSDFYRRIKNNRNIYVCSHKAVMMSKNKSLNGTKKSTFKSVKYNLQVQISLITSTSNVHNRLSVAFTKVLVHFKVYYILLCQFLFKYQIMSKSLVRQMVDLRTLKGRFQLHQRQRVGR